MHHLLDLWQLLGSTQLAELTALIGLALSLRPTTPSPSHSINNLKKIPNK